MAARSRRRPSEASFYPPAMPEPADADASLQRPWVLLDKKAYIAKCENATTARAPSSGGHKVQVSFCLADPPALSYLCVHCPGPEGHRRDGGFSSEPLVAAAEGAFVLISVRFNFGPRPFCYDSGTREYFVYRAGPGKPWLGSLPQYIESAIKPCQFGILPIGSDDGKRGFVVAALVPLLKPGHVPVPGKPLELVRFSSAMRRWYTMAPRLDPSCGNNNKVWSHETAKVIVLGGGFLGWVDLWRGILVCNVLDEHPVVSFIPLPKTTVPKVWKSYPWLIRDVTSCKNLLSFVEIQIPKTRYDDLPSSYWEYQLISDSDSDSDSDSPSDLDTTGSSSISHGWRATKYERTLFTPSSCWRRDCNIGSADILHGEPSCYLMLPQLRDAKTGKLTLDNLNSSAPVLTMHDDGVVYMMSTTKNTNVQESWVAAFDLRKNALKKLAPCYARRTFSVHATYSPCSFSKYFDRVPGQEPAGLLVKDLMSEKLHGPLKFFAMVLLSARDQLCNFDKTLEFESKSRPSLHASRASCLHASIQAVVQYAPRNGGDEFFGEAVGKCVGAMKDLESWIVKSKNHLSVSINVVRSKINLALRAIDRLMHFISSTLSEEATDVSSNSGVKYEDGISADLGPKLGAISIY